MLFCPSRYVISTFSKFIFLDSSWITSILFLFNNYNFVFVDTFSKPVSGSDEPQQGGWFRAFTIAAYKPYFDVDTSDVLERIKDSLLPFTGSFSEKTADNPDLYAPPSFIFFTELVFILLYYSELQILCVMKTYHSYLFPGNISFLDFYHFLKIGWGLTIIKRHLYFFIPFTSISSLP